MTLGLLKSSDLTAKNNGSVIRGTYFKNSIWAPLITALLTTLLRMELEFRKTSMKSSSQIALPTYDNITISLQNQKAD